MYVWDTEFMVWTKTITFMRQKCGQLKLYYYYHYLSASAEIGSNDLW